MCETRYSENAKDEISTESSLGILNTIYTKYRYKFIHFSKRYEIKVFSWNGVF